MLKAVSSPLFRYGFAVAAVALALLLTLLVRPLAQATIYSLSFAAVIITAWYAGLGPGLVATALAGLAVDYFFIGSPRSLEFDPQHLEQVGVFMIVAILIGYLTAARKQAEEELRKAQRDLEIRVQERTRQLAEANKELQAEVIERKNAEARQGALARELEERNSELWRLQGELKRVEPLAALGRITGTIAHELGTPLNSVLGYTQLLAQEKLTGDARRRLEIIKTQVERMADIIGQYLSRVRGSFQKRHRVNVNELIEETLVMLRPIFQQRGIQVRRELSEPLPLLVADGPSLQRVLINLLDNAVDAMGEGGTVTVATVAGAPLESGRHGVIIKVADTGAGVPPELLPKIFDIFVTTKAPGKGTGLGLAICQEIIKGHGGTIEIASEVGKGASVRIFLPADEERDQPAPAGERL